MLLPDAFDHDDRDANGQNAEEADDSWDHVKKHRAYLIFLLTHVALFRHIAALLLFAEAFEEEKLTLGYYLCIANDADSLILAVINRIKGPQKTISHEPEEVGSTRILLKANHALSWLIGRDSFEHKIVFWMEV